MHLTACPPALIQAREARAFCLNIGGAGVTVEKLSELRGVLATLRSAPGVFGPIRATNSARLLRLKVRRGSSSLACRETRRRSLLSRSAIQHIC